MKIELRNESGLEFTDVSSEQNRETANEITMKQKPKFRKINHPGYGRVEGFNYKMDFVFSEDVSKWQRRKPEYVKKAERAQQ